METEIIENRELDLDAVREAWPYLTLEDRQLYFSKLSRLEREELFLNLKTDQQIEILSDKTYLEKRAWLRLLPLDDVTDFIQNSNYEERSSLLELLDIKARSEVLVLLAYAEDDAGGLMNPAFVRLRPEMSVDEGIRYLRSQSLSNAEAIYYAYVLDSNQKLLGSVTFKDLLLSSPNILIQDIMDKDTLSVSEETDQEEVSRLLKDNSLMAIPVLDNEERMKGVVTFDDLNIVMEEETTEDMHKIGGMEALESPYFTVSFLDMIKKRAGWLMVLFVGEMFTATAMGYYEHEIQRAVVLALFIPLIISSGGNSGSQATTLIIRSLALREVTIREWKKVFFRELNSGLILGCILGLLGFFRIVLWEQWTPTYGTHYILIALTVAISLVGVVVWGTLSGSMLPFILKSLKLDPASASAPFVATLVDVLGVVIYFTVASLLLKGSLL